MQGNDADSKTASTASTANTQSSGKAHHGHRGKKGQSAQIQQLNADITSILTPDQATKFNQMLQQMNPIVTARQPKLQYNKHCQYSSN